MINPDRPGPAPARPTRSLVMWSGGLDSTYSLVRLLASTDDEVHAHHVHCDGRTDDGRYPSRRCEYEAEAVGRMLEVLREHYRPFEYGESRVDLSCFSQCAPETTMAMYFAAQVALTQGFTPFDRIVLGVNADHDAGWQADTHAYAFRRMVTVRMLKAVWESEEVPFLYVWNPRPSKQREADELPYDLFALTASCRDPDLVATPLGETRYRPCGVCPQCVVRGRITHRDAEHGTAPAYLEAEAG